MNRGRRDPGQESNSQPRAGGAPPIASNDREGGASVMVGSPEDLQTVFARAAAVADRAVGLWLSRASGQSPLKGAATDSGEAGTELRSLRALLRASTTAYARRLRNDGATPERMLVLVKAATVHHVAPGFGAQQLTDDIVRWSIEAYFDE